MKWVVVNSLPLISSEDSSLKVPFQSTKIYLYFSFFNIIKKLFLILLSSPMQAPWALGDSSSPHHLMNFWKTLLMFRMMTCYIIGRRGFLCLYPRLVNFLRLIRRKTCIFDWSLWLKFNRKRHLGLKSH
jgi:hypothetical protein